MDNSNLSSYSGLSNRNIGRNVVGFGSGDINHSDGKKSSNLSRQSSQDSKLQKILESNL